MLEVAESRFGLGTTGGPPWVRERVGAFLDNYMARKPVFWTAMAARVIADQAGMSRMVGSLRVGETRFFRDASQWSVIVEEICAIAPAAAPIAALSAGCSSGEEAYTLAILLAEKGRRFEILGVDRSREAIGTAYQGTYAAKALREMPAALVEKHFEPEGAEMRVRASIRAHVTFGVCDLVKRVPRGPFHLILFKNVMLYLAEPFGTQVAARLADELSEQGLLFSTASEVVRLSSALEPRRLAPGLTAFRPRRES